MNIFCREIIQLTSLFFCAFVHIATPPFFLLPQQGLDESIHRPM